jgi:hypothetical protein
MKKLLALVLMTLLVPGLVLAAGYPVQYCDAANPTRCFYVTVAAPLPVRFAAGAVGGLVQVAGANGTSVATAANPFPVRLNADGTNPMDATHPLAVSATLGANVAGNPIHVQLSDGTTARKPPWGVSDDDDTAGEVGLNVATQNFALPTVGLWYCMTAQGGAACVTCGAANPPTTNMTTDCTFYIPESGTRCEVLTGPNCGVISPGTVAAGYLRFTHRH